MNEFHELWKYRVQLQICISVFVSDRQVEWWNFFAKEINITSRFSNGFRAGGFKKTLLSCDLILQQTVTCIQTLALVFLV